MNKIINALKALSNNDYVYSVIARVFGVLAGLIYSIMYSRYLGTELRGEASIITNFSSLASLVLSLGVYQAYPYFRKTKKIAGNKLYTEYVNCSLGMFMLYLILCGVVAVWTPISISRKISLILIPFLVGTRLLNYVVLIENPKVRNTASIYLYLIDIVLVGVLMAFTKSNLLYCYTLLIAKEVIYFLIAIHNLDISLLDIRPTVKFIIPYIKYGWIPMITIILMEVNYKVDVLMLDGKVSVSAIGIYSLGVQLAERMWLIPDALKDILLSKLTKGKGEEEVARITRVSLATMTVCIAIAVLFGRFFITLLFGEEYSGSYEIMIVILLSVISMVFYKMVYAYNVANGYRIINMLFLSVAATANVIINYFLIPQMGTMGAAIASLISYSICGLAFLLYFIFKSHVSLSKMVIIKREDIQQLTGVLMKKK